MTGLASKWKVFILDEAEKLSNSAQIVAGNAFLKTLEEPGEDCLFLLITSKYELRTQNFLLYCNNFSYNS